MIIKGGSARYADKAQGAQISRRPSASARSQQAVARRRDAVLLVIGVAAFARLLWDSRAQQHVIMFAIGLAAVAALARESQARSLARLAAWDRSQNARRNR
ncbi:MAG: hypothetical protein ABJB47_03370 [Actinomycetota bacterium]